MIQEAMNEDSEDKNIKIPFGMEMSAFARHEAASRYRRHRDDLAEYCPEDS